MAPAPAHAAVTKLRSWLQSLGKAASRGDQTLVVEWTQDVERAKVWWPYILDTACNICTQLARIPTNLDVELDIQGPLNAQQNDPWDGDAAATAQWLLEVLFGGSVNDPMDDTDDMAQIMASMVDIVREVQNIALACGTHP